MTVSSIIPVNNYTGNASATIFDFDFLIEKESELVVTHISNNGVATVLKQGVDYSINEIGNKFGSFITFPLQGSNYNILQPDEVISLALTLDIKQESEFQNSANLNLSILEWTFDYIVRILQIMNRNLSRAVKVTEGSGISPDKLINDIKESEQNSYHYLQTAIKKADEASDSADSAKAWAVKTDGKVQNEDYSSKYYANQSEKFANIADEKAQEADEKYHEAIEDIQDECEEKIDEIKEEAEKQREKIQTLGFFQKDGKFYYLDEDGEETPLQFEKTDNLFDLIQKDHILTFEEKEGLELLGEYVYKEAKDGRRGYSDFYEACLKEYKEGTSNTSEISGVTIKINSNGHKFYNISDKAKIDEIYKNTGSAWYYGIDEENKRILLPRFDTIYLNSKTKIPVIGSGYPLKLTPDGINSYFLTTQHPNGHITAAIPVKTESKNPSLADWETSKFTDAMTSESFYKPLGVEAASSDPKQSGLLADLSTNKENPYYIYIVVGNTSVKQAKTEITELTASENDTIPLGTSMYSPEILEPNAGWVKSTGVYLSGKIYETFYNKSIAKIGQAFCSGFIKESTDSFDDYDLVINQEEMTFRLPLYNGSENIIDGSTKVQKTWGTTIDLTHNSIVLAGAISGTNADHYIVYVSWDGAGNTWNVLMEHDKGYGEWMSTPLPRGVKVRTLGGTENSSERYIFLYRCKGNGDLYFKLGNALENQQLIDCGEVLAELNTKTDKDEVLETMSSDGTSIENFITLGTSGAFYTSPGDGYVAFRKAATAANQSVGIQVLSNNSKYSSTLDSCYVPAAGYNPVVTRRVSKGQRFSLLYTAGGETTILRFTYLKGVSK